MSVERYPYRRAMLTGLGGSIPPALAFTNLVPSETEADASERGSGGEPRNSYTRPF